LPNSFTSAFRHLLAASSDYPRHSPKSKPIPRCHELSPRKEALFNQHHGALSTTFRGKSRSPLWSMQHTRPYARGSPLRFDPKPASTSPASKRIATHAPFAVSRRAPPRRHLPAPRPQRSIAHSITSPRIKQEKPPPADQRRCDNKISSLVGARRVCSVPQSRSRTVIQSSVFSPSVAQSHSRTVPQSRGRTVIQSSVFSHQSLSRAVAQSFSHQSGVQSPRSEVKKCAARRRL